MKKIEEILEIDVAIIAAEAEYAKTGQLYDAEAVLPALRREYFGE